ncbi:cytochrome P450 2B4-like [Watersipora subatra]|uniref:cytochrome P450 2B4-like n=1 Tax=Watersipora subatra TaxID=2589382 RepID=UPI00355AF0DF
MVYLLMAITAVLLLLFLYQLLTESWRDDRYPAGPYCLPIVGNMLQLMRHYRHIDVYFSECRRRFGNVFTLTLGGSNMVVVSGYEAIHKLLVDGSAHTSSRSTRIFGESFSVEDAGLLWATEPQWKWLRSFLSATLAKDNLKKMFVEEKINKEVARFISHYISRAPETRLNTVISFSHLIFNIKSLLITNSRICYGDENFLRLFQASQTTNSGLRLLAVIRNTPIISYFFSPLLKKLETRKGKLLATFLRNKLSEHKSNIDFSNRRDVMACYLLKQQELSAPGKATYHHFAGQKKVSVIEDMPYVRAVIMETLRVSNIMPAAMTRTTTRKMEIDGKVIPSESDLVFNMSSILHDPHTYDNPLQFYPERHFNAKDNSAQQRTCFGFDIKSTKRQSVMAETSMSSMRRAMDMGEKLGLKDAELAKFIEENEPKFAAEIEREERRMKREAKKRPKLRTDSSNTKCK